MTNGDSLVDTSRDPVTQRLAAGFGVSVDEYLAREGELIERWAVANGYGDGETLREHAGDTRASIYQYIQTEEGFAECRRSLPEQSALTDDKIPPAPTGMDPSAWLAAWARFDFLPPHRDAARPPLEYWEHEGFLPKGGADGRVGFLVAPSHAGKTTAAVAQALDVLEGGGNVLFCCGEGAHDVRTNLLPAACDARRIDLSTMEDRWRTLENVPWAQDRVSVQALIARHGEFVRGGLIVLDTWATVIAGEQENDNATASHLTGNGAVRELAKLTHTTVLIPAHTGKNEALGLRGASAFHGNSDFVQILRADKAAKTATLHLDKMKGGPSGSQVPPKFYEACTAKLDDGRSRSWYAPMRAGDYHRRVDKSVSAFGWKLQQTLERLYESSVDPLSLDIVATELVRTDNLRRVSDGLERLSDAEEAARIKSYRHDLNRGCRPDRRGTGKIPLQRFLVCDDAGLPLATRVFRRDPRLAGLADGGQSVELEDERAVPAVRPGSGSLR